MIRVGQGYDSHKLVAGRKMVLGGVQIESERGLEGHSDADVLVHAIMDALLGSIAAGDIGKHFPPDDPQWKDASSLNLLKKVLDLLSDRKARILNIDSTIVAEEPKLAPFIPDMCSNIAEAVGVGNDCVSVKATTAEQMGALGRKEGIAAMAVVLVEIEY